MFETQPVFSVFYFTTDSNHIMIMPLCLVWENENYEPVAELKWSDMYKCIDIIRKCDGWTDRQNYHSIYHFCTALVSKS